MNAASLMITGLLALLIAVCLSVIGYLLLLLSAAFVARRRHPLAAPTSTALKFAIVVPAHNEELVIASMLASVQSLDYPADKLTIVVIADNCTDRTEEIARAAGATVLNRTNDIERGKGYALAEATRTLLSQDNVADAFVIVDADTYVAANFLKVMAAAVIQASVMDSRVALQGRYGVLNGDQGWRPALMSGAFDLFNHVKPLGREALGLSAGLKGNGMVFTRSLLEVAPFTGASITEDIDFGLDLLIKQGVRVRYVPDAVVKAQMPVTGAQAKSQRERWENGRGKLMRERVPALISAAVQRRDIRLADAAIDLLLLPLAEIATLLACWTIVTIVGLKAHVLNGPAAFYVGALTIGIAGFITYVLAGFKVADAPGEAYFALLRAPSYALWKILVLLSKSFGRLISKHRRPDAGQEEWIRTERIPLSEPGGREAP